MYKRIFDSRGPKEALTLDLHPRNYTNQPRFRHKCGRLWKIRSCGSPGCNPVLGFLDQDPGSGSKPARCLWLGSVDLANMLSQKGFLLCFLVTIQPPFWVKNGWAWNLEGRAPTHTTINNPSSTHHDHGIWSVWLTRSCGSSGLSLRYIWPRPPGLLLKTHQATFLVSVRVFYLNNACRKLGRQPETQLDVFWPYLQESAFENTMLNNLRPLTCSVQCVVVGEGDDLLVLVEFEVGCCPVVVLLDLVPEGRVSLQRLLIEYGPCNRKSKHVWI